MTKPAKPAKTAKPAKSAKAAKPAKPAKAPKAPRATKARAAKAKAEEPPVEAVEAAEAQAETDDDDDDEAPAPKPAPKRRPVRATKPDAPPYVPDPASDPPEIAARARLRAPFRALAEVLGKPHAGELDGGKVSTWWVLVDSSDRDVRFFVHDLQDEDDASFSLAQFRAKPRYDWYVGAPDRRTLDELCRWLSKEVIQCLIDQPPPRRMTAAAKAKINEMIAGGMSPGDAISAAAEWEQMRPVTEEFAWPIAEA